MKESSIQKKKEFKDLVDQTSPKPNLFLNCLKAFLVGGTICIIGQFLQNLYQALDMNKSDAGTITSMTLVFLGALFTGLNLYEKLGEFAGAGSIIPITGFANSITSPAMEYKKEGYVLGVGAKMFTIAGPVIVYGVIASVIVGVATYLFL